MAYDCFFITLDYCKEEFSKYRRIREKIPNVRMVKISDNNQIKEAVNKLQKLSNTEYMWVIDPETQVNDDFDWSMMPEVWDNKLSHVWYCGLRNNYSMSIGVKLIHKDYDLDDFDNSLYFKKGHYKEHESNVHYVTVDKKYDIVYLSYNEPFADENYQKLLEKVSDAKRVRDVKGIFNAHKVASEIVDTDMFYVVDADAEIVEDFEFDYYAEPWDRETVHVWKSRNPVNDLEYGYGGVKLFPTKLLRQANHWNIDFTTSVSDKFRIMDKVSNYTTFNTDPFNTWKSAFRECVKLSSNIINRSIEEENNIRLDTWCTVGKDRHMGEFALLGANSGKQYGEKFHDQQDKLNLINDFDWLKTKFEEENNG